MRFLPYFRDASIIIYTARAETSDGNWNLLVFTSRTWIKLGLMDISRPL